MVWLAVWLAASTLLVISGDASGWDGPIPQGVAHQSPLRLLFLQLQPEPPAVLPRGALEVAARLAYSNTALREIHPETMAEVDVEQFHPTVALEYGLLPGLQVGVEFPFIYSWEGGLDPVIHQVEESTGNLRFVRKTQPRNGFRYVLIKSGKPLIDVERGAAGLGDIVLKAKGGLGEEARFLPAVSWRAAVKVPIGEFDRALGSGEPDVALGLIAGKRWGPVGLSLSGEWSHPLGNPLAGSGIRVGPWVTGTLVLDIALSDRLALFGSLRRVGSPYRRSELRLLTGEIWETSGGLTLGLSPGMHLQIGFIEDLFESTERSADITIFLNVIARRL